MVMADSIDTVTDTIEDVPMRMYMYNISQVTEHALKMTDVIVKCCNTLKDSIERIQQFPQINKAV